MSFSLNMLRDGSNYGKLIILIGLLVMVPPLTVVFYPEEFQYFPAFLIPGGLCLIIGTLICYLTQKKEERQGEWQSPLQKGSLPVLIAWVTAFIIGAFPFVFGRQLDFLHGLFESVSGWTTTGLSVANVDDLPRIFLFHRSFMQFCGGLGFIIIMAMLVHGKQSMNLYNAEGHPDRLMPSLKRTARAIFLLYSGFCALGTVLYWGFGMDLFDAVCHAMAALSTAGFSTRVQSIGAYQSPAIEVITIVLMLIGTSNFAVLLMFTRGRFKQILQISEVKLMIALIMVATPLIAFSLRFQMGLSTGRSLLNALFGVVTAFSTTGYGTMDYSQWPPFALGLFFILMFIGGSAGSTAGGIKLIRVFFLFQFTRRNLQKRLSPSRHVKKLFYQRVQGKTPIDSEVLEDTIGFIACYFGVFIIGTLLLALTSGGTLFEAMFDFASAFSTVGITNGLTTPAAPVGTLWVQMAGMVLGRLEIFIVFIGISSAFKIVCRALENLKENIFRTVK